jgi:hypothetical protein
MKNTLVLNDWHVGSPFGLQHPNYVNVDGQHIDLSHDSKQDYLYDNFEDKLESIRRDHEIHYIQYMGDIIDGLPAKGDFTESALPRIEDQIRCARMLLEEVRTRFPKAIWNPFVFGTKNHEKPEDTRRLAMDFIRTKCRMTYNMRVVEDGADDVLVRFHHEVGFSGAVAGRSGSMEREIVQGMLAYAEGSTERFDAEVRGHVHYHARVLQRNIWLVTAPSFQIQNLYGTKPTPNRFPSLGFLVVHTDGRMRRHGQNPVDFTAYTFNHPKTKATTPEEENGIS